MSKGLDQRGGGRIPAVPQISLQWSTLTRRQQGKGRTSSGWLLPWDAEASAVPGMGILRLLLRLWAAERSACGVWALAAAARGPLPLPALVSQPRPSHMLGPTWPPHSQSAYATLGCSRAEFNVVIVQPAILWVLPAYEHFFAV